MSKAELETVNGLIADLNFYQILKLSPIATEQEIRDAFHREALNFHPDQYFSEEDKELPELAKSVYSKIVKAYRTLSNRKTRATYDDELNRQSRSRLKDQANEEDEDAITGVKFKAKKKSPGDKFFRLAEQAYKAQDYRSALMNIQIALGSDPGNRDFLSFKNRVESLVNKK